MIAFILIHSVRHPTDDNDPPHVINVNHIISITPHTLLTHVRMVDGGVYKITESITSLMGRIQKMGIYFNSMVELHQLT